MGSYELKSIFAPLPVTVRGQNFHLNADPKNEKFIYCSGPSVVVRDLKNPLDCYMYNEHATTPTAACFAPSGFYVASGDTHGKIRVWDTTQETHILKYECNALGGTVRDITWSPDSKRILCSGEGRDKRAHCFMWDSGSSCGVLGGHSKTVNAVAHRPDRPYKAVTVSEDYQVIFYDGVPYKYNKTCTLHKNFVNSVRYAPTGATFCTASSDKRSGLFDGKTGDLIGQFTDGGEFAHGGGVMACGYSADGLQVMTASADKTVKVWDVETQKVVVKFDMGKDLMDQQLGCLWAGEYMLSLALSGEISYLDKGTGQIVNTIKGHQKSISALAASGDKIVTGDFAGRMVSWQRESGRADYFTGGIHKNKVHDLCIAGDSVLSVGVEGTVQRSELNTLKMGGDSSGLDSAPECCDTRGGLEVFGCESEIVLMRGGKKVAAQPVSYKPFGVAISPDNCTVAVGDSGNPIIYLYTVDGDSLAQFATVTTPSPATEICYSSDGAWIGAGGAGRHVIVIDVNNSYKLQVNCWTSNSRITTAAFSPNSQHLAIGGIDSNLMIMEVAQPMSNPIKILRAHPQSTVSKVRWTDDNTLISTASDAQVRAWQINLA